MTHVEINGNREYSRFRAAYDAAFRRWAQEVRRNADAETIDRAWNTYQECRNQLANYLISLNHMELAMAAGANGSSSGPLRQADYYQELQALAYRLWEECGRPAGNPDEYWYRAEKLLSNPNLQPDTPRRAW